MVYPTQSLGHKQLEIPAKISNCISVSIVIGTCNRPDELSSCLQSLIRQQTSRCTEIIVVDNTPAVSTPQQKSTLNVVAEWPEVKYIKEFRQGVSYARNAGIVASTGDIIVTVDDDVVVPPDWLENLLIPFTDNDVMAVTGNVLPLELKTKAQKLFEQYGDGGLGRGPKRIEANKEWFEHFRFTGVPTWLLGGTANAAFRKEIFTRPNIGLMKEALGPGMPSGVGEDIYLFYKILQAGYKIIYEPNAYLWHKHRSGLSSLQKQLYNYSKGIVAYHLTTLLDDRDLRALSNLFLGIPLWHLKRLVQSTLGKSQYPIFLILTEIAGNFMGPWSLWKSIRRVHRQDRSYSSEIKVNRPVNLSLTV